MRTPRLRSAALLALAASTLAACAREPRAMVPVECKAGPPAVREALRPAPAPVRLEGVPLSACFTTTSDTADIATVGTDYLTVASDLSARARERPDGREALQLGYLVGAVRRGAARTQGVNDEMVRRLDQELLVVDTTSAAFRRGERAGREGG